jgi:hypothetical protein
VTTFYAWYLGRALKGTERPAWVLAFRYKGGEFSSDLVQQLREDLEAQRKAGSDLVSLDGDPFIGADGPAERYVVKRITKKDGRCWAEVHAVWNGEEDAAPDVTPELVIEKGRWLFVNFYFPAPSTPSSGNLLSMLKALRELRKANGIGRDKKP